MTYLIDTNVISELRKGDRCDANVSAWYSGVEETDMFLSVLVLGEMRRGIERIRRRDPQQTLFWNAGSKRPLWDSPDGYCRLTN